LFDLMAIDAGDAARFMRAARPENVRAAVVAVHTNGVLFSDGVRRILPKPNGNGVFSPAGLDVGASRTMASLAASRLFGRTRLEEHGFAHDGVFEAAMLIVVAADAGVAADVIAVGLCRRSLGFLLSPRVGRSRGVQIGKARCAVRLGGVSGRRLLGKSTEPCEKECDNPKERIKNDARRCGSTHRPSARQRYR